MVVYLSETIDNMTIGTKINPSRLHCLVAAILKGVTKQEVQSKTKTLGKRWESKDNWWMNRKLTRWTRLHGPANPRLKGVAGPEACVRAGDGAVRPLTASVLRQQSQQRHSFFFFRHYVTVTKHEASPTNEKGGDSLYVYLISARYLYITMTFFFIYILFFSLMIHKIPCRRRLTHAHTPEHPHPACSHPHSPHPRPRPNAVSSISFISTLGWQRVSWCF